MNNDVIRLMFSLQKPPVIKYASTMSILKFSQKHTYKSLVHLVAHKQVFIMGFKFCFSIIVLTILIPSRDFKVIPAENQKEWKILETENEVWDKVPNYVEEDDHNNQEETSYTDLSSGAKIRKNKKIAPKTSIVDTRYPDRPDLELLTFPSEFMSGEREKLLQMVDSKFGHLVDANVLKKVAKGNLEALPNVWNFLSNYDVKGAFTALLAQQFFQNFASADEHPVESSLSREECKKLCKDKEIELIQLINGALIRLTQTETKEGEDIRIRLRPSLKKCFKYETANVANDKHSTCTCTSSTKNIYVSPQLKDIINERFFRSVEGDKEIKELIEHTFIAEKPSENENSAWDFTKLGHVVLNTLGYGSDKRRRREPKRYDKHWLASKTEWIVLNAIVNILILGFCFPLWPFHVLFFLIGWFFV